MKKGLLLSISFLMSVAVSAQDIEGFINRQLQTYPKARLQHPLIPQNFKSDAPKNMYAWKK